MKLKKIQQILNIEKIAGRIVLIVKNQNLVFFDTIQKRKIKANRNQKAKKILL